MESKYVPEIRSSRPPLNNGDKPKKSIILLEFKKYVELLHWCLSILAKGNETDKGLVCVFQSAAVNWMQVCKQSDPNKNLVLSNELIKVKLPPFER